jgi:capping protein beta
MFEQYRKMFFQGDVSSVYFWDLGNVFGGVVLIKKFYDGNSASEGCCDSIHFVVVEETQNGRSAHYKFTSTVMFWLQTDKTMSGMMNLARKLTQQFESHHQLTDFSQHIINIGTIVQQIEKKIHEILNSSDSEETKDILNGFYNSKEIQDRVVLEEAYFTGKL